MFSITFIFCCGVKFFSKNYEILLVLRVGMVTATFTKKNYKNKKALNSS